MAGWLGRATSVLAKPTGKRQGELTVNWRLHVLVFVIAFAIIVARRPDALFNAQFWAEDGKAWYADAYNLGAIRSLFLPYAGYFNSVARLTASFAQFLPLAWAPLIFNLVAIIIQILPATLVTSSRFATLIPNLPTRLFLAFAYLARPNSFEINATLTGSQWHLALLACMVVLAASSQRLLWRLFDIVVILLSALSGPFSILLTPIAAFRWWLRRENWAFILLLGLYTGAVAQATAILITSPQSNRLHLSLGAAPELFLKILAGQVFLGALIGQKGYAWVSPFLNGYSLLLVLVASAGVAACLYGLLKGPLELRLFIAFAALIFGTSLLSPTASMTIPQWEALCIPGNSARYWFIPMLAFVTLLTWLLRAKSSHQIRLVATVALAAMLIGIVLDWSHPAFADLNFRTYSNQFAAAPEGTKVTIPINPPGWTMDLIKH